MLYDSNSFWWKGIVDNARTGKGNVDFEERNVIWELDDESSARGVRKGCGPYYTQS
jgi:hypothetical protein